jgi:hypothetical protein
MSQYQPLTVRVGAPWRTRWILLALAAAGGIAGFAWTGDADASRAARTAGPELAHLLQMMAVLKAVFAAGTLWLADWRLRRPIGPRAAALYVTGVAMMSVSPGLIWSLAHIVLGAALFHAGLALLIVLACNDSGVASLVRRTSRPRARHSTAGASGPATPGGLR